MNEESTTDTVVDMSDAEITSPTVNETPSIESFDPMYNVYVKLNEKSDIIAINSSAFLSDITGWVWLDSGNGDKYHHAQGNYFDKPIIDDRGIYNYKMSDDNIPVEKTDEDKAADLSRINACTEISILKAKLAETDYVAAKIAEGSATIEEYGLVINQRQEWRARINELE